MKCSDNISKGAVMNRRAERPEKHNEKFQQSKNKYVSEQARIRVSHNALLVGIFQATRTQPNNGI